MIKGALFDIDDTLYSHELDRVPKATLKALDKLRAKGIRIGICTSRIAAEMADLPEELLSRLDCQILGTGATTVVEGKYFKSYSIAMEDAKRYTDYFNEHQISYHYTDINGDVYYWGDLDEVNNGHWLRSAKGNVKFKIYEDEEVTNLFYYHAKDEEVKEIAKINPEALISRWGNSGNICTPLVDKSFGLLKFCQVFSFTTDEVVAAGDGGNDDVMLAMAGIGIAVDDAKENTKAAADYICKRSIEDGGLYEALVELGVIEEDEYEMEMFVFDNDSTLFDHTRGYISDKSLEALHKLKDQGRKLVLNTSRSPAECRNIPNEVMEMMDAIILLNGAYIIYPSEVTERTIPKEDVDKIISFLDAKGITYRYCDRQGRSYLNRDDERKAIFRRLYDMEPEIKAYEGEEVLGILYYAEDELRKEVMSVAANEENCYLKIAGEIAPKGLNKGTAMLQVAEYFGIEKDKVCAFGDGGNDVKMLEMAGLSVAMGNGSKECKLAADRITDNVSDEGVYKELLRLGFIQE